MNKVVIENGVKVVCKILEDDDNVGELTVPEKKTGCAIAIRPDCSGHSFICQTQRGFECDYEKPHQSLEMCVDEWGDGHWCGNETVQKLAMERLKKYVESKDA